MTRKLMISVRAAAAVTALLAAPLAARAQSETAAPVPAETAPQPQPVPQPIQLKGMISAREGAHLTIAGPGATQTVVTLTESTKVTSISGALGLQRNDASMEDLITGLPVNIDATQTGAEIDANKITFKAGDMKTARQIEAGTAQAKANVRAKAAQLQAQNDELKRRMSQANQYDEKAAATVLFATGSAAISAQGKADLQDLATRARAIKGYLVSVIGYADPTGNAEANQKLSERRAAAVINYLQKSCGLAPQRVLAGDAMGDSQLVGDTSTAAGLAQNRRVVVKVLTNKGLEGL